MATGKQMMNTRFRNSGRIAGHGMVEDSYSENSGNERYHGWEKVRFPHDNIKPEELNGPVIIVREGRTDNG